MPAKVWHCATISARIRDIDRMECEAFGHTPKQSLRNGFWNSDRVWTATVDGRPEAMFGVVVQSALCGEGVPWMLGTDAIYRHGRELVLHGPSLVKALLESVPRLANMVSADNHAAIRLLRRWGFTIGGDRVLVGGIPFLRFEVCR